MPERVFDCPGPYLLRSVVDGPELGMLDSSRVPTTLEFICRKSGDVRASVHAVLAAKIACMLRDYPPGGSDFSAGRFNCFCAVLLAGGSRQTYRWIEYMKEQGKRMGVQDAIKDIGLPATFQLCGQHLTSKEPDAVTPLHMGIVVGEAPEGPIVFEKVRHAPMGTAHWPDMEQIWAEEPSVAVSHYTWLRPEQARW